MSYLFDLTEAEIAAAELVSDVGRKLQRQAMARKAESRLTQKAIADRLGIDRARVNKALSGSSNLTLKALAELAWAMDATIHIDIRPNPVEDLPDLSDSDSVDTTPIRD